MIYYYFYYFVVAEKGSAGCRKVLFAESEEASVWCAEVCKIYVDFGSECQEACSTSRGNAGVVVGWQLFVHVLSVPFF